MGSRRHHEVQGGQQAGQGQLWGCLKQGRALKRCPSLGPSEGAPVRRLVMERVRDTKRPPKLTDPTRKPVSLDELQRSTAQVGQSAHRATIGGALHKPGLYRRGARRKPREDGWNTGQLPSTAALHLNMLKVSWADDSYSPVKSKLLSVSSE